jgi:hypothetical protein
MRLFKLKRMLYCPHGYHSDLKDKCLRIQVLATEKSSSRRVLVLRSPLEFSYRETSIDSPHDHVKLPRVLFPGLWLCVVRKKTEVSEEQKSVLRDHWCGKKGKNVNLSLQQVKLSALSTGRSLYPTKIPNTHFC